MNVYGAPVSVTRFSGLAQAYDRYRPSYPRAAVAAILDGLPLQPTVIDVGAGTGISTAALVAAGAHAIAIEPNSEMRAVAQANGLDARDGSAHATGLADRCADVVTCFQAFHWFANDATLREFARLLRAGGRIALVWNERDVNDAFTSEFRALERHFGEREMLAALDFNEQTLEPLMHASGFGEIRRFAFENPHVVDGNSLIGLVRSTSYAPRSGPQLEKFEAAVRALHERYAGNAGTVALQYRTDVFIASPSALSHDAARSDA